MSEDQRPFVIGLAKVELLQPPEKYREAFAERRSIFCRNVFEPDFLALLSAFVERASYTREGVDNLLFRTIEQPPRSGGAISLALRRPNLLRWIERVTDCEPLATVSGRVAQIEANPDTTLDWHNDMREPLRRIGITINLGSKPYEGGAFELRERDGGMLTTHRHVEQGGALIFDVGRHYLHRVLPVTSGGPRRVYTGWFYRAGD